MQILPGPMGQPTLRLTVCLTKYILGRKVLLSKNVLQFLMISAHNQFQSNWVSRFNYYLPTLHGVIKSTHETAPFFLYNPIKMATHSSKGKYKNNDNEKKGLEYCMIIDVKNQNDPFMIFFHV